MKTYIYKTQKRRFTWLKALTVITMLNVLFFTACKDETNEPKTEPVAAFSTAINELEVTFTNTSTDATIYAWDFGDGNTSAEKSPVHTYATAGSYSVTLTAKDADDQSDVATESVTVSLTAIVPVADFTFAATNLDVQFTDASADADSYSWDFGDNAGTSTDASPSYTYAAAGNYDVMLTVTSSTGNTHNVTKQVTVTAPAVVPTADFTFAASNLAVQFTDASADAASYSWDFGDNTGTSTDASPSYTYAAAGTYDVVLTVTSSTGNTDNITKQVTVSEPAPAGTNLVLNGTFDEYTNNTGDNADAWDMTPNSTVVNNDGVEIDSPYRALWYNSDLNDYIDANYGTNEQPGSSSDGSYVNGVKTRGGKFSDNSRRLYQVITVEAGATYTFSIDTRAEAENINTEVFILNTEITTETGIDTDKADAAIDAYQEITAASHFNSSKGDENTNTFHRTTFDFTASTNKIVVYVRALNAVDSSNEVFLDNVSVVKKP